MSNTRVITLDTLQNDSNFIGIINVRALDNILNDRGFLIGIDSVTGSRGNTPNVSRMHSGEGPLPDVISEVTTASNNEELLSVALPNITRSDLQGLYLYRGIEEISAVDVLRNLPPERIIDESILNYFPSWDTLLLPYDLLTLPSVWIGTGSIALAIYFNVAPHIFYEPQFLMDMTNIA